MGFEINNWNTNIFKFFYLSFMELIRYTLKYKIKKIITNSHIRNKNKNNNNDKITFKYTLFFAFDIKEICTK